MPPKPRSIRPQVAGSGTAPNCFTLPLAVDPPEARLPLKLSVYIPGFTTVLKAKTEEPGLLVNTVLSPVISETSVIVPAASPKVKDVLAAISLVKFTADEKLIIGLPVGEVVSNWNAVVLVC